MRTMILVVVIFLGPFAFASGRISAGTGIEGRMREEVNPDSKEGQLLPHFFAQYRLFPFGLSIEGAMEEHDTHSGALKIESRSYQTGLWGRYEFAEPLHWSPFAGLGAGAFFDEVTSKYKSEVDQRSGRRGFFGLSGGISHSAWRHLLFEAEMRAIVVQDRKDVAYSGILRVGFLL